MREAHDPNERPIADLLEIGLLWLINRVCFHPRGYALALHVDDDGSVTGWSMLGDGTEVWNFSNESDDENFAKVASYFRGPVRGPVGSPSGSGSAGEASTSGSKPAPAHDCNEATGDG